MRNLSFSICMTLCVLMLLLMVDSISAKASFRRLGRSSSSMYTRNEAFTEKEAKEIADKIEKAFDSDPKIKEGTLVFDEKGNPSGKKEPEAKGGKLTLPSVKPKETVGIMVKDLDAKDIEAIADWLKKNKESHVVVVADKVDEKTVDAAMKKEKVNEADGLVWVFHDKGKKIFGKDKPGSGSGKDKTKPKPF